MTLNYLIILFRELSRKTEYNKTYPRQSINVTYIYIYTWHKRPGEISHVVMFNPNI